MHFYIVAKEKFVKYIVCFSDFLLLRRFPALKLAQKDISFLVDVNILE